MVSRRWCAQVTGVSLTLVDEALLGVTRCRGGQQRRWRLPDALTTLCDYLDRGGPQLEPGEDATPQGDGDVATREATRRSKVAEARLREARHAVVERESVPSAEQRKNRLCSRSTSKYGWHVNPLRGAPQRSDFKL
jgi:hypothetical protein